jgi:hypothetical protein
MAEPQEPNDFNKYPKTRKTKGKSNNIKCSLGTDLKKRIS